jgi:hypothetical protein
MRHQERLTVPWWGWLLALAAVAAFTAPLWLGTRWWVAIAVLLATTAGLWWLGRIRVAVVDGVLIVDDARLPVRFVADAVPLDAAARSELLGPAADPLAFVVQRPWIGGAVRVVLDDPADPTPYWLVSTRHPDRLASALLSPAAPADRPSPDRRAADRPARESSAG